jgi:hypothetical protein
MDTTTNTRHASNDREVQTVIYACLRLILDDMRARYHDLLTEIDRLQKAGVAVGGLYKQLGYRKEVNGEYVPPDPDRGVQRAGV